MYDELVKSLRLCTSDKRGNGCASECSYGKKHPLNYWCMDYMLTEAADAIEELQVIIRAQKAVLDQAPHWIPSEDCLPVNGEEVITLGPNGGMECGFYRGLCGTKRDKWEWKKHTVRTVKYWIPRKALPEPPEEE